jgi:hypothetical protein
MPDRRLRKASKTWPEALEHMRAALAANPLVTDPLASAQVFEDLGRMVSVANPKRRPPNELNPDASRHRRRRPLRHGNERKSAVEGHPLDRICRRNRANHGSAGCANTRATESAILGGIPASRQGQGQAQCDND